MPEIAYWLIFLLPLFSFLIISLILRPFFNHKPKLSGYVTIGTIALSLLLSIIAFIEVSRASHLPLPIKPLEWVPLGDFEIRIGLLIDRLTVVMLLVVSSVSLMVQIYSQGYMHGDPGYCRYFAFMSLFTASMLGLVLASNLLFLYVFWELVGLCSYLLIGFWFHRPSAAAAAKKAFLVTRLGDFGLLAAIIGIYFNAVTFDIREIPELLHAAYLAGTLSGTVITWLAIGIFSGAVGKSAQFPLHVWLPDAMEGPTPVSSLIHAATMVAAGVFLVARMLPLFALPEAQTALTVVAVIGGFTAIFAATMGLVMNDIKRVLAYSTISQLGYMMLGLGAAGRVGIEAGIAVGIFHLFTHAYFKCLLFLGAGSVNHATGTFDMREMGGLRKYQPWTFATFLAASLSISGIWPFAGFWSKEGILAYALEQRPVLFYLAMITVFLTALYIFRALFMTFGGEYRGKNREHLQESPPVMVVPMVILAIMSVVGGCLGISHFLGGEEHGFFEVLAHPLPWVGLVLAGLGIFLAYAIYSARWLSAEAIGRSFRPLYVMLSRKYWFDDLYEGVIVVRLLVSGIFRLCHLFDVYVVDGLVNGLAQATVRAGGGLRKLQMGQLQEYGLAIGLGIIVILAILLIGFYI